MLGYPAMQTELAVRQMSRTNSKNSKLQHAPATAVCTGHGGREFIRIDRVQRLHTLFRQSCNHVVGVQVQTQVMMQNGPVNNCLSAGQRCDERNFLYCNGKKGADYLDLVSDQVSKYKHESFTLKNPAGATLRIGGLGDTIYKDADSTVNGWGKFYLPDTVHMQVIGVVEGTSCPCDPVLMTCEDRKLYAYDGEELHLVASSLEQLHAKGIEYPASKSYYKGDAFKDMTEKDWAKVKNGPVGRKLAQEHQKRLTANKSDFLENLRIARQRRGVIS